jgi:predicted histone-like DNA-binding protein
VDLEDIAEEIAYATTATEADVKAVLSSLQKYVIEHLKNGQSVRLGDLCAIRTTMSSTGVADKDSFASSNIKKVRALHRQQAHQERPRPQEPHLQELLRHRRIILLKRHQRRRRSQCVNLALKGRHESM